MYAFLGKLTGAIIIVCAATLFGCMVYAHLSLPDFARGPYLDDPYREEDAQIRIIRNAQRQSYRREAVVAKPYYYNFVWEEDGDINEISVTVSQRYVTDFASIPFLAGWFVSPFGKHSEASMVHDWLYAVGGLTRKDVDSLLYAEMRKSGVDPVRAAFVYTSVRFGGLRAYGRENEWRENFYDFVAQSRLPVTCIPSREEANNITRNSIPRKFWRDTVRRGEFLFLSEQRALKQENDLYNLWHDKYMAPDCEDWLAESILRLVEDKYLLAPLFADEAFDQDLTIYQVATYNYLMRFRPSDELLSAEMMLERICKTSDGLEARCMADRGNVIDLESSSDEE